MMPEPIPFDLADLRAGTVWEIWGDLAVITECSVSDEMRERWNWMGVKTLVQRVSASISLQPTRAGEPRVKLTEREPLFLSGFAWSVPNLMIGWPGSDGFRVDLMRRPDLDAHREPTGDQP